MRSKLASFLKYFRPVSITEAAHDERIVTVGATLVSYFYYFAPFVAFYYAATPLKLKQNFDPLWPLFWTSPLGLSYANVVDVLAVFCIGTALLGAFLYRHRLVRFLVFLGFWQAHALESSFGTPNHQWYMWVYVSLIFVMLPDIWRVRTPSKNRIFLLYVWGAQALVALMYSMAGLTKVMEAVHQYLLGQINAFSMEAFAYQIAYFVPRLQERAALAPLIVEHPIVGWFPYVALVLVQLFSLWIMVRPSLSKPWVFFMVLFHFLTYFTMGIAFHPQIILVILLFFASPFAKPYTSFVEFLRDLPIIGQVVDLLTKRRI